MIELISKYNKIVLASYIQEIHLNWLPSVNAKNAQAKTVIVRVEEFIFTLFK